MSVRTLASRLGAYTVIQVVSYVAPLAALPVLARATTPAGWVSFGTGQAVGGLAAVVILFGWWTAGPGELAAMSEPRDRYTLYRRSLLERALIASVALPVGCMTAVLIAGGGHWLMAVLSVLATANMGLSPSWYFVASSAPLKMAMYETAPRVLATVLGAVGIVLTGQAALYPAMLAVVPIVAYCVGLKKETPGSWRHAAAWAQIRLDLRHHVPIASSNIMGGVYSQLLVPLVALASPGDVARFVSGDRLYKGGRFTIVAAGNTLQPWVLESPTRRRHVAAIACHGVLGLAGLLACWALIPPVSRLMFGPDLAVSRVLSLGLGAGFMFSSLATPLIRNVLIPNGRRWGPFVGTLLAAIAGVAIIASGHGHGSGVIGLAVGVSELACFAVCLASAVPVLRGIDRQPVQARAEASVPV